VRLRALQGEVTSKPGEEVTCRFALDRTSNFTGAVELDLEEAPGFTAEKVRVPAGSVDAVMKVRVTRGLRRGGSVSLRFRATGKLPSGAKVVALATVNRSEEHTSELQSLRQLVCRLLLEKKNNIIGPR